MKSAVSVTLWKGIAMNTRNGLSRRLIVASGAACLSLMHVPALGAEPIKIGFGMSLSGPNAGAGKMFLIGREIWKDELNSTGGLLGRPVQFVYYADQSNPSVVPGIYSKLLDIDRVDLLVSPFATNQIAPAMPVVMERKMTFMALFGTG